MKDELKPDAGKIADAMLAKSREHLMGSDANFERVHAVMANLTARAQSFVSVECVVEVLAAIDRLSASKPAATEDAHSDAPLSLIPDLVKLNETSVSTALLDMGDAQMKWRAEVQMYREITPLALSAYSDGYEAGIAAILCALAASPAAPAQSGQPVACIAPACHQWDGTDTCTCDRQRVIDTLKRVATALPVLKTMLAKEGLGGVTVAEELLVDIQTLLAAPQPSPTAVVLDERADGPTFKEFHASLARLSANTSVPMEDRVMILSNATFLLDEYNLDAAQHAETTAEPSDCRDTCDVCWGENGQKWPCAKRLRSSPAAPAQSAHPDDQAVDQFAAAMKEKLAQARAKGRGGWQQCNPATLSNMLREHVEKGDPRDVANFCMFLWWHKAAIAASPQATATQDATDYEALEREHLGDPDKRTGIYATKVCPICHGHSQPGDCSCPCRMD